MRLVVQHTNQGIDVDTTTTQDLNLEDQEYTPVEHGFELSWELMTNKPATQKFLKAWHNSKHNKFEYNMYSSSTPERRVAQKQRMNQVIDIINTEYSDYLVDSKLKLNTNTLDSEYDKLSTLHFYFESTLPGIEQQQYPELYSLLEEVNQLVHSIEGIVGKDRALTVVRKWQIGDFDIDNCFEDSEFEYFTTRKDADLFLDLNIVGKTIENCFDSKDVQVVKDFEVKYPTAVYPSINYVFANQYDVLDMTRKKRNIERWLEANNIAHLIDISSSKYNPGGTKIGVLQNDLNYDQYNDLLKQYPNISGVYLLD